MKHINYLIIIMAFCFLSPHMGFAHKVIIFAWVEDGMIHTESSFGSKRKAINSKIRVKNESGILVHEGKTDTEGNYSFKIPAKVDSDLVLTLEAGTGHQAQWRIPKEELVKTPDQADLNEIENEKQRIEKSPSVLTILAGIAIIFCLAWGLKLINQKTRTQ